MTSWFATHQARLIDLFEALGIDAPTNDPGSLAAWAEQEGWLGADHGRQPGKPLFDRQRAAVARGILRDVGLDGRVEPSGHFDEIVVMGAAGIGLHRRLELVRTSTVTSGGLTVLAGLRPHEASAANHDGLRRSDGDLLELLASDGRFGAAAGWRCPRLLAHCAHQLDLARVDRFRAAAIALPTETDLAELLLVKQWPLATLDGTYNGRPHPVENELGQRQWTLRTWTNPEARVPILRILNGAPVNRATPDGRARPARPTALSTFDEWLVNVADSTQPREVLVVVNQPHLGRTRLELLTRLDELGRSEISISMAGCETLLDADIILLLGEIPSWIRADQRRREMG